MPYTPKKKTKAKLVNMAVAHPPSSIVLAADFPFPEDVKKPRRRKPAKRSSGKRRYK